MAYRMLFDHHVLPHEYAALPLQEKAMLQAFYMKQGEELEKAKAQAKSQQP